jgi:hypothetical protein
MIIYLAAVEQGENEAVCSEGIDNAFASFFYTKEKTGHRRFLKCAQHIPNIVMDSGAHSFFSASATIKSAHLKRSKKKHEHPDAYFARYLEWLKENHHHLNYFVELDIGEIVGQSRVEQWREKFAANGLLEKSIIVYHPAVQSLDNFLAQMREHPSRYVALEGFRGGKCTIDYVRIIRECYDAGVKVHGFAMTKPQVLDRMPFYSVDSASWKTGIMYGAPFLFSPKMGLKSVKLFRPKTDQVRSDIASILIENNFPVELLPDLKRRTGRVNSSTAIEVLKCSATAVKRAQNYYTSLWQARGVNWQKQTATSKLN